MAFNKFQGFTLLISFLVICLLNAQSYDFAESGQGDLLESITDTNGDIDTQAVERVSRRYVQFLPQYIRQNGKLVGGIIALIVAIAAVLKYYMSGRPADWPKYMEDRLEKLLERKLDDKLSKEEKDKVALTKSEIVKKVKRGIRFGNATPHVEGAKILAKECSKAQSKLGVIVPDFTYLLSQMTSYKPLPELDTSKDYIKAVREEIDAGTNPKIDDECKAFVKAYDDGWQTLTSKYTAALSAEMKGESWLKVLSKSDKELVKVDVSKPVEEILNPKKE